MLFFGRLLKKSKPPLHTHLAHDLLLLFFFPMGNNFKYFSLIYSLVGGGVADSRVGNEEDEVKGRGFYSMLRTLGSRAEVAEQGKTISMELVAGS